MNASLQRLGKTTNWSTTGWLLLAGLVFAARLSAQTVLREYDAKAGFLYNFITFTEWPATAFPEEDSPFVIGILGDDPFGPILDGLVKGEQVGKHSLVVRRFKRVEDARTCQLLFISASEGSHTGDILRRLRGLPVLTVGETPGFAQQGGAVGFVTASKIQLNINSTTVKNAGLVISSKILRLAHLVDTSPGGRP